MSFNGSGTFVINSSGQPVVANTVISSTVFNALTADLATGLSTCITKDGQTTPTANIPMGTFKFTNLGNGSAATDSATLGQVQASTTKLVTVSGTDTITGTMTPALTAYATGQMFYFVAGGANTGAVTLNIDGLGARNVTRHGSVALVAGDILSGEVCVVVYDGTRFQLLNPASYTNLNVTGVLSLAAGTALLPSLAFSGDPNTGLWSPAADTLAASTGGSERLRVDSSGNLGIGTASPAAKLDVVGTAQVSGNLTLSGGTANGVAYLNASKVVTSGSALTFNGTDFAVNTGSITSGNSTFAGSLVAIGGGTGASISITPNTVSGANGVVYNTSFVSGGSGPHVFQIGGSEQMRLTSTGLGIGTASPGAKLDVVGTARFSGTNYFEFNTNILTTLASDGVHIRSTISTAANPSYAWSGDVDTGMFTPGANTLGFTTGGSERMRLDANGNIVAGASAALATTATNGFLYVPTCAGTPTGTPTAITGMAPIVVNTTNNKLYFYSGGAWRDAGP